MSWKADAALDHEKIIQYIKEQYGQDLSDIGLKVLGHAVYTSGKKAPKYRHNSLGSAAGKAILLVRSGRKDNSEGCLKPIQNLQSCLRNIM